MSILVTFVVHAKKKLGQNCVLFDELDKLHDF